jgi:hypothetical protein
MCTFACTPTHTHTHHHLCTPTTTHAPQRAHTSTHKQECVVQERAQARGAQLQNVRGGHRMQHRTDTGPSSTPSDFSSSCRRSRYENMRVPGVRMQHSSRLTTCGHNRRHTHANTIRRATPVRVGSIATCESTARACGHALSRTLSFLPPSRSLRAFIISGVSVCSTRATLPKGEAGWGGWRANQGNDAGERPRSEQRA